MFKNLSNKIDFDPTLDKLTLLNISRTGKTFILHKDIKYFVKYDQNKDVIYSEYKCLLFLDEKNISLFPKPFGFFSNSNGAYLICEFINFKKNNNFFELGLMLAQFHQNTNINYGFSHDTYCGPTLQINSWNCDWYDFFFNTKIKYQLDVAIKKKYVDKNYSKMVLDLLKKNKSLFLDRIPSLIHGDLWNGNFLVDNFGAPVLVDPAVYFASREIDIAMSKLFGGFSNQFYESYNEKFPLEKDWQSRNLSENYLLHRI